MKKLAYLLILIFYTTLSGCGGGSSSSSTTSTTPSTPASGVFLRWYAPTTNADGSALNDLAGYKIYYGSESGNYNGGTIAINSGLTTSYDVEPICSGYCCFAVVAVDNAGNESGYSQEICTNL